MWYIQTMIVHNFLQVNHQMVEDHGVHVLVKLHENEPVPKPELLHNHGNITPVTRLGPSTEYKVAEVLRDNGDNSEGKEDTTPCNEGKEPKPEEDINLFINNIDG